MLNLNIMSSNIDPTVMYILLAGVHYMEYLMGTQNQNIINFSGQLSYRIVDKVFNLMKSL